MFVFNPLKDRQNCLQKIGMRFPQNAFFKNFLVSNFKQFLINTYYLGNFEQIKVRAWFITTKCLTSTMTMIHSKSALSKIHKTLSIQKSQTLISANFGLEHYKFPEHKHPWLTSSKSMLQVKKSDTAQAISGQQFPLSHGFVIKIIGNIKY